jgi:hypothetical protein
LSRRSFIPKIENPGASLGEAGEVARHDRQVIMERSGGDEQVGLRKCNPGLASRLDEKALAQQNVFAYRQNAIGEHRANFQAQPIRQICSTLGVWVDFGAVPDLSG